jgi:hypothetical protein
LIAFLSWRAFDQIGQVELVETTLAQQRRLLL